MKLNPWMPHDAIYLSPWIETWNPWIPISGVEVMEVTTFNFYEF